MLVLTDRTLDEETPRDRPRRQVFAAYTSALAMKWGEPFWLACLMAIALAAILGFCIGVIFSRTRGQYFAIGTMFGVRAVDCMDIAVAAAAICGIIGPNGSGKTTLLGLLSGTYRPDRGTIRLLGRRLDGLSAHRTVGHGVARTFQTTRLFFRWTLAANLLVAAKPSGRGAPVVASAIGSDLDRLMALVGLRGRGDVICASLSNSEQRLAMIAVALATRPRLLLLDEPAVGMSSVETDALARVVRRIRDDLGVSVVIVEHNMHFMMNLADRIVAMSAGRKLAEGTPAEVRQNPDVIAAYLGG